jgi:hypothetical protein
MKKVLRSACAVVVVGVLTAPALGQVEVRPGVKIQPLPPVQPGGGILGGAGGLVLVNDKGVREELKITDEQAAKLKALNDKQQEAMATLKTAGREGVKKYQETLEAIKKDLDGVLTPAQGKRLKQLEVQQRGAAALFDQQIAKDLELNAEQTQQIVAAFKNMGPKMREIFKDFQGDREAAMKKVAELNRATLDEVVKSLTPAQQAKWKEIAGEPYKGTLPGAVGPGAIRPLPPNPGGIQIQPIQRRPVEIQPIEKR